MNPLHMAFRMPPLPPEPLDVWGDAVTGKSQRMREYVALLKLIYPDAGVVWDQSGGKRPETPLHAIGPQNPPRTPPHTLWRKQDANPPPEQATGVWERHVTSDKAQNTHHHPK